MSQLVQNDPLIMQAQSDLEHFTADAEIRDIARRRRLWKLDYHMKMKDVREEGEVSKQIKNIIHMLQRSHGNIPESLEKKIHAITNLQLLDRLHELAYDRVSLEEFEKNIP